ncbi:MAG: hypothetical protein WB630_14795 [Candidatus Acidiferrales bacterium]
MTTLDGNLKNFINNTGIYRVWVPLQNDGKPPLISIWMNPKMTAFKSEAQQEPVAISGGDWVT